MKHLLFALLFISFSAPLFAKIPQPTEINKHQIIKSSKELSSIDKKMKHIAYTVSKKSTSVFENAIQKNIIKEKELFSTLYFPLTPLSSSPKFTTFYDKFIDKNIAPIQNEALLKDSRIIYIVIVDINGYLPSHNRPFTIDTLSSTRNRTKRIFNDRTGLLASKNKSGFILQHYNRDTGESIADLSVPVYIKNKHWGSIRVGYKRN